MKLDELLGGLEQDVRFCGIQAFDDDYVVVLAVLQSLEEQQTDHCFILTHENGEWSQHLVPLSLSSFCLPERGRVVALTPDGMVISIQNGEHEGASISSGGRSFSRLRNATEIIERNSRFFVAGMGRDLFMGKPGGEWRWLSEGIHVDDPEFVGGFLSLDLDDAEDICAVGFHGEIWFHREEQWHRVDSPTNQRLTKIKNAGRDMFRICGANGVLLEGHGNAWRAIDHDFAASTFWDMSAFAGDTCVCSSKNLLRIDNVGSVYDLACPIAACSLSGTDKYLWAVGTQSVACFDGTSWKKVW